MLLSSNLNPFNRKWNDADQIFVAWSRDKYLRDFGHWILIFPRRQDTEIVAVNDEKR